MLFVEHVHIVPLQLYERWNFWLVGRRGFSLGRQRTGRKSCRVSVCARTAVRGMLLPTVASA